MRTRGALLWLLTIFVGIQFGAGLYEKLAIVPLWADVPGSDVQAAMTESGMHRAGRAFWPFVSPVVALLAVANVVAAYRTTTPNRRWWLAAAVLMTVYAAASYGYFVPHMLMFQNGDWSAERTESFVDTWTSLNYARMVVGGAGWLCALRALSLSNVAADQPTSSSRATISR